MRPKSVAPASPSRQYTQTYAAPAVLLPKISCSNHIYTGKMGYENKGYFPFLVILKNSLSMKYYLIYNTLSYVDNCTYTVYMDLLPA